MPENETFATNCPAYDLEMVERAIAHYDEIAGKAATGLRMLKMAGITPGFGIDVWSHNVSEYSARTAAQLRELLKVERRK